MINTDRKEYEHQYYLAHKAYFKKRSAADYLKNKEVRDKQHTEYRKAHLEEARIRTMTWQNSEQGQQKRKEYYEKNKKRIIQKQMEYKAMKHRTDPMFRAKDAARGMIKGAISRMGYTKKARSIEILGCSWGEFKVYIEKQFTEGMTWLNHGDWHIDHKVPLMSATTEEQVLKLNHYTNLQPLWMMDNLKKGPTLTTSQS